MNTAELVSEVTAYPPHLTDVNVAERRGVAVESLRAALRLPAFMGFVEHVDGNVMGHTWAPRIPNDDSRRLQRVRAALGMPLDGRALSPSQGAGRCADLFFRWVGCEVRLKPGAARAAG